MPRTIAHLIREYFAPVQPDDCKRANLDILARALQATGPVTHEGSVYSASGDDDEWTIDVEAAEPEGDEATGTAKSLPVAADVSAPDPDAAPLRAAWRKRSQPKPPAAPPEQAAS